MEWKIWSILWIDISDIQDYFEYFLKKREQSDYQKNDYPSIRIPVNKIENTIIFIIKRGYYLKLLSSETI